jgi:dTDP-4-dehydrorhamnose reductase
VIAIVAGAGGFIGRGLMTALQARKWQALAATRQDFDLLDLPASVPAVDVVYICAAMTRFIDCEADPLAYRVNVDAPMQIARLTHPAKVIYLSSEAVERALHTNYGQMKALAEMGLRTVCDPVIVRLSKVTPERRQECCEFLAELAEKPPGIYRWA